MTTKEFAKKWFETLDAKNYDQLKNMLADNHVFNVSASPQPLNREGHLGMMQQMFGGFGVAAHTIDQLIAEGDWVTVRGRWKAKHTGDFNGIPASGKMVDLPFIDIMHVVNGKLEEEYMEWNAMTLMTQIGVIPQPA